MSKNEAAVKKIVVEGLLSLQAGDSASAIEDKLKVYLPPNERNFKKKDKEEN
jgi:chemotaxis protein MotA